MRELDFNIMIQLTHLLRFERIPINKIIILIDSEKFQHSSGRSDAAENIAFSDDKSTLILIANEWIDKRRGSTTQNPKKSSRVI